MTDRKTPQPYILASNLVLIVFILSIVYQLLPNIHIMAGMLWLNITMKCLLLGFAILLRFGYTWTKFLLAFLAAYSTLPILDVLEVFSYPEWHDHLWSSVIQLIQIVLMVIAAVVVFRKE